MKNGERNEAGQGGQQLRQRDTLLGGVRNPLVRDVHRTEQQEGGGESCAAYRYEVTSPTGGAIGPLRRLPRFWCSGINIHWILPSNTHKTVATRCFGLH